MRMFRTGFLFLILGMVHSLGLAQESNFSLAQFIELVGQYHPIALQADLLERKGQSTVRSSRGAFDPYLFGNMNQKEFKGKNYYSLFSGGLKVPTWYGIELKTGYDQNRGVFLNPQESVPANGLWYGGISVSVGKGLIIDKRRAALRSAQLYAESTAAERRALLNSLLRDAVEQYWRWVESWNQFEVYRGSVELAQTRFEGVRSSYLQGDKPAIDTLEAFIQVQTRTLSRDQFELDYQNETIELNNYLWFENLTPLEISDSLRPPTFSDIALPAVWSLDSLQDAIDALGETHPEMQLYGYKLGALDIERRLKAEALKPKVNLNYNVLNEPEGLDFTPGISPNNYKWGFEIAVPVLLRKERGDLQMAKLKIQDTEYSQEQKLFSLQNKVRQYYNSQLMLQNQVGLFGSAVQNYQRLLAGEQQKFRIGESSLFLVNSRETKFLDAQLKLIELRGKYWKAWTGFYWGLGRMAE